MIDEPDKKSTALSAEPLWKSADVRDKQILLSYWMGPVPGIDMPALSPADQRKLDASGIQKVEWIGFTPDEQFQIAQSIMVLASMPQDVFKDIPDSAKPPGMTDFYDNFLQVLQYVKHIKKSSKPYGDPNNYEVGLNLSFPQPADTYGWIEKPLSFESIRLSQASYVLKEAFNIKWAKISKSDYNRNTLFVDEVTHIIFMRTLEYLETLLSPKDPVRFDLMKLSFFFNQVYSQAKRE